MYTYDLKIVRSNSSYMVQRQQVTKFKRLSVPLLSKSSTKQEHKHTLLSTKKYISGWKSYDNCSFAKTSCAQPAPKAKGERIASRPVTQFGLVFLDLGWWQASGPTGAKCSIYLHPRIACEINPFENSNILSQLCRKSLGEGCPDPVFYKEQLIYRYGLEWYDGF